MCSIAGSKEKQEVEKMLAVMKHRSPDGVNSLGDEFIMGMGRLAIIDLETKDLAPYEEDGIILSFNGEVYNYIELREELSVKGWQFHSTSDIEVLMKAYREWGIDCLDRLNGMFAFAIYDKGKIYLARDIAGEKPLYFRREPFAFASEAKALSWDCEEFPPASYGIYDLKEKSWGIFRWWNFVPKEIVSENAAEELEKILEDAVRIRTRADVPYGLYYSGGMDSALIDTYHTFDHKFTYTDGDYKDEFLEIFPKILWHLDYPVKSFSPFGLWKLAEMASKEVKVVLSGEGADELFGGYIRYLPDALYYQAQKKFPSYKKMFPYSKDVNQWGWEEFNGNLRELLRMGDRLASAFGMENRCPFLDRRVIEFAFSLPPDDKVNGFQAKAILNKILLRRNHNYKPIEKKGLYCSVNEWLGVEDSLDKEKYLEYQAEIWKGIVKFQS